MIRSRCTRSRLHSDGAAADAHARHEVQRIAAGGAGRVGAAGTRSETDARALDAQPALVSKGDKRSSQPIHWATMTRQLDAIDELLRRGADINAQRMDGARPFT